MPRNYVDNAMNRSLGRVGLPVGSAVHSRSSGSASSRTYVDNAMNRNLGCVGLPLGTAVHSPARGASYGSISASSNSSNTSSTRTYVDNAMNRNLGRVGLPLGTAVHSPARIASSRPSSSSTMSRPTSSGSTRTYIDNMPNRRLCGNHVGLPVDTAVHSREGSAGASSSPAAPQPRCDSKVYKDNALNRKLNRVGLPLGSAVHRKGDPVPGDQRRHDGKVYADNDYNKKVGRAGLPLGSKPISRKNQRYQDNAINRHLNRVDEPLGTRAVSRDQLAAIRKWLLNPQVQIGHEGDQLGISDDYEILSYYNENDAEDMERLDNNVNHVLEAVNRKNEEDTWMETNHTQVRAAAEPGSQETPLKELQCHQISYKDLEIKSKIGHGGFGEVYFAIYKGMVVAVKKLIDSNITKKRLKMFQEEIKTHSSLSHPNIVRFYGTCLERPNLAIVMEYMDGSLWETIHINEVNLLKNDKLKIMFDITAGLDYLHSIPLAHGDLKTQNVLLINIPDGTQDCPVIIAKLSDFGLSMLRSDSETSQSAVAQSKKQPVGATLRYAPPEIICGEFLSEKELLMADIYSLGMLFWELVMEEIPFESLTLPQLQKQVGEQGMVPSLPSGLILEEPLQDLLNKCWSYKPVNRPSAKQLQKMVSRVGNIFVEEE